MFNRSHYQARSWAVLLTVLPVLAYAGCTGGGTDLTSGTMSTIIDNAKQNTLFILISNGTSNDITATIAVDGVSKTLPTCTSVQQTCNYALTGCPSKVELIEEIELNTQGQFVSGRNFQGDPGYTFQSGHFSCGGQIIYSISDTAVTAMAF